VWLALGFGVDFAFIGGWWPTLAPTRTPAPAARRAVTAMAAMIVVFAFTG
jgi:hypothetical protein